MQVYRKTSYTLNDVTESVGWLSRQRGDYLHRESQVFNCLRLEAVLRSTQL